MEATASAMNRYVIFFMNGTIGEKHHLVLLARLRNTDGLMKIIPAIICRVVGMFEARDRTTSAVHATMRSSIEDAKSYAGFRR